MHAKGALKSRNKHGGALRLFAYLNLVIIKGKGFLSLGQCEVIHMFDLLLSDYDKIITASYFAESVNKTVLDDEPCENILQLLLYALRAAEIGRMPLLLIRSAFEFKLMQYIGFAPQTHACFCCETETKLAFFDEYGMLCVNCAQNKTAVSISGAAVFALKYILEKTPVDLFKFTLPEAAAAELAQCAALFIRTHSDASIKSRRFL